MEIRCNLVSISSALLAPYKEASKHFSFAWEGRVQHAAQKVFSQIKDSEDLSLKERVFHILGAIALSIPFVNLISHYFIPAHTKLNAKADAVIANELGGINDLTYLPYKIITTNP